MKTSKTATPTTYEIVPEPGVPDRWCAAIHRTSPHNGECLVTFGGSFKTPEECQKTWAMEIPTNAKVLRRQGFKIRATKPKAPEKKVLLQHPTEKTTQGHPRFWNDVAKTWGPRSKASTFTEKTLRKLALAIDHIVTPKTRQRAAA